MPAPKKVRNPCLHFFFKLIKSTVTHEADETAGVPSLEARARILVYPDAVAVAALLVAQDPLQVRNVRRGQSGNFSPPVSYQYRNPTASAF